MTLYKFYVAKQVNLNACPSHSLISWPYADFSKTFVCNVVWLYARSRECVQNSTFRSLVLNAIREQLHNPSSGTLEADSFRNVRNSLHTDTADRRRRLYDITWVHVWTEVLINSSFMLFASTLAHKLPHFQTWGMISISV